MQLRISPSMRSITISSSNGVVDSMKVRVAPQPPPPPPPLALQGAAAGRRGGGGGGGGGGGAAWYLRVVAFPAVVALGCLLPFAFILLAVPALEAGGSKCSSIGKIDAPRDLAALFFFPVWGCLRWLGLLIRCSWGGKARISVPSGRTILLSLWECGNTEMVPA